MTVNALRISNPFLHRLKNHLTEQPARVLHPAGPTACESSANVCSTRLRDNCTRNAFTHSAIPVAFVEDSDAIVRLFAPSL